MKSLKARGLLRRISTISRNSAPAEDLPDSHTTASSESTTQPQTNDQEDCQTKSTHQIMIRDHEIPQKSFCIGIVRSLLRPATGVSDVLWRLSHSLLSPAGSLATRGRHSQSFGRLGTKNALSLCPDPKFLQGLLNERIVLRPAAHLRDFSEV
mgnify:CR=1 FL=1